MDIRLLEEMVNNARTQDAIKKLEEWLKDIDTNVNGFYYELLNLHGEGAEDELQSLRGEIDGHEYNQYKGGISLRFLQMLKCVDAYFQEKFPPMNRSEAGADFDKKLKTRLALYDYTLGEKLRVGKSVAVYAALDNAGKEVLIKALISNELPLWKAKAEINLLQGGTKHENVIQVLNSKVEELPYFIVAEYAKGNPLSDTLIGKHVPLYTALEVLIGICKGCQFMRSNEILAANFHPHSISMTEHTVPLLSPFTFFRSEQPTFSVKHFARYATYQSPERLQQEPESIPLSLAEKADMFSIALIGYELLTGEALFGGETIYDVIHKRVQFFEASTQGRDDLLKKIQHQPSKLRKLFVRMLDRSTEARPKDLDEVINALENLKPNLSEQQRTLLKSYGRCLSSRKGDYVVDFYESLFAEYPWAKEMFVDPAQQFKKLRSAIKLIIESGTDTSFVEQLPTMGRHGTLSFENFKTFVGLLKTTICRFDPLYKENSKIDEAWASLASNLGQTLEQTLENHPRRDPARQML